MTDAQLDRAIETAQGVPEILVGIGTKEFRVKTGSLKKDLTAKHVGRAFSSGGDEREPLPQLLWHASCEGATGSHAGALQLVFGANAVNYVAIPREAHR